MTPKILKKHPSAKMKRDWLTLYYEKKVSLRSIADDYGYPYSTVWRTVSKMDPNRKVRKDKGKSNVPDLELPDLNKLSLDGESPETQIELVINALMSVVMASKKLKPNQAITYISQLTNTLKRLRSIQFAALAKEAEPRIIETIIRMYEPTATDMRVIEVFKQAVQTLRGEK